MYKLLCVLLVFSAACQPRATGGPQAYMQILYMGPNWVPGHDALLYSPAFRGRQGERVADTDSTLQVAPTAELLASSIDTTTTPVVSSSVDVSDDVSAFDGHGHLTPGFIAQRRQARRREITQELADKTQKLKEINRKHRLRLLRLSLSQHALTKALTEAAADGWEVVQVLSYGAPEEGRLLYLLKRH